jgi:hypothetical protein
VCWIKHHINLRDGYFQNPRDPNWRIYRARTIIHEFTHYYKDTEDTYYWSPDQGWHRVIDWERAIAGLPGGIEQSNPDTTIDLAPSYEWFATIFLESMIDELP